MYLWKFFHIKSKHYGLEIIYPDEEKITYSYNLGGQLEKVHGYKSYGYDYVSKIGYDKFEQRTYLKYCNGAETFYTYAPQCPYNGEDNNDYVDGEVVQYIEYVPFGEVFVEERNNISNNPLRRERNGKR